MLKLRFYGDPVLRKIAKEVLPGDLNEELLKEMSEIMYTQDGVGLAAPQVGISKRFFVYDIGEKLNIVVNPQIIEKSREIELGQEGCLSIPDIYEEVPRSVKIKVKYTDQYGNEYARDLEGYEARVFQHEFDHLNGKLFIDHLSLIKRRTLKPQLDEIKEKGEEILKKRLSQETKSV
ncbi:MAG: peptide deformylase [Mesoaciditoga sp.]|uniref:peptide deformylase n=1 Tax=Athalassotoga sp. TaxID=2022597 RepID=UPI000CAA0E16|nr:MAG: peptide deformylase [Mesoaciditoga sp.]PMP80857.1 MAG: peptide deformylase [Mesoaciditoga sp.]HEU24153.1 peptide deformylase [Mesoaciditoga lauensis]